MTIPETAERIELKHLGRRPRRHQPRPRAPSSSSPPATRASSASSARCAPAASSPHVIPAVSSVALAFARLGLDWDDALVVSAHGRDPGKALAAALAHPKAAILTAPGGRDLAQAALLAAGKQVYVAELLGIPGNASPPSSGQTPDPADPNILISLDQDTSRADPAGWPATRAPRTAGRCPRTPSPTATR